MLAISCPVFAKDPRTDQYLGFAGYSGELQAINSIITRNRPLITPNYPLIGGRGKSVFVKSCPVFAKDPRTVQYLGSDHEFGLTPPPHPLFSVSMLILVLLGLFLGSRGPSGGHCQTKWGCSMVHLGHNNDRLAVAIGGTSHFN